MEKVVVIGLSGDSEFLSVNHFNYPGETVQATDKFSEPGGKGYNQATFLGSLGVDVSFITALGNDIQAEKCLVELKKRNVKPYIISKVCRCNALFYDIPDFCNVERLADIINGTEFDCFYRLLGRSVGGYNDYLRFRACE